MQEGDEARNLAWNHASASGLEAWPELVPPSWRHRLASKDDPLIRQVAVDARELAIVPGFVSDPLAEAASQPVPGLLHKYHGRVLLLVTSRCGVHCRFCFRRHGRPEPDLEPGTPRWERILTYLRADHTIQEVILSGGDPLTLTDDRLASLVGDLATIQQLRRLRIHSRLAVIEPDRLLRPPLAQWFGRGRLRPVLVVHANHPDELTPRFRMAARTLARCGVALYAQSVLLAGVNDHPTVLSRLWRRLEACAVVPYYLHLLDPVAGAAHFAVDTVRAKELMTKIRARLPGYLVPRLVRELPEDPAKRIEG